MSGKKYSLYLGGKSDIIGIDSDDLLYPSPKSDDLKHFEKNSQITSDEKQHMTEVEIYPSKVEQTMTVDSSSTVSIPPEVEAVYKSFTDFLQSKDINKFETLKPIPNLGINGLPITEKQMKLLYEYNPFLATQIIPNDVETRQEYDLDNDEFKNISVGDFLTKKYLNSVRNLDNNFFRTLLKDDIAGVDECSYCHGNLNDSQASSEQNSVSISDDTDSSLSKKGGAFSSEITNFFNDQKILFKQQLESGYKNYIDLNFIDILKIIYITGFDNKDVNKMAARFRSKNITDYLSDTKKDYHYKKLIKILLFKTKADETYKAKFIFKSHEWNDTENPNKKSYLITTGPASTNMVGYEALFFATPTQTGVLDYIKTQNFKEIEKLAPTIKSKEHILKAFLLQIILFTISEGPTSENFQALDEFLKIIGVVKSDTNLSDYLDVRYSGGVAAVGAIIQNIDGIEEFVETHLEKDTIPMFLITNVTTRNLDLSNSTILSSLLINTKLRTTSEHDIDLSKYLSIEKLDKILNLLLFNILFGNPLHNIEDLQNWINGEYVKYSELNIVDTSQQLMPIDELINPDNVFTNVQSAQYEQQQGTKLADNWFCYNYDSSLNDLEQMCFYKRNVPPDPVEYKPPTSLTILSMTPYIDLIKTRENERKLGIGKIVSKGESLFTKDTSGNEILKVPPFTQDITLYFKNSRVKNEMQAILGLLSQLVYASTNHVKNVSNFLKKKMSESDKVNINILDYVGCFAEDPDYPYGYDAQTTFTDNGDPTIPAKAIQHRVHAWIYYPKNIKKEYQGTSSRRIQGMAPENAGLPLNNRRGSTPVLNETPQNVNESQILGETEVNNVYLFIAIRGSKTKADWDNTDVFISSGEASNVYTIFEMHSIMEEIRLQVYQHMRTFYQRLGLGNPNTKIHTYTCGHSLGGFFATAFANLYIGSNPFKNTNQPTGTEPRLKTTFSNYAIPCVFNPFYKADTAIFAMINSLPRIHIHRVRNFNQLQRSTTITLSNNPVDFDDLASCFYADYFEKNIDKLPQVSLYEYSNCIMRGVNGELLTADKFTRSKTLIGYASKHLDRFAVDSAYGHSMENFNGAYAHFLFYRILNNLNNELQQNEYEPFQFIIESKNNTTIQTSFKYLQPTTNFDVSTMSITSPTTNKQHDESPIYASYKLFYEMYGTNNGVYIYNQPTANKLEEGKLELGKIVKLSNDYINSLLRVNPDTLVPKGSPSPKINTENNRKKISFVAAAGMVISSIFFKNRVGDVQSGDVLSSVGSRHDLFGNEFDGGKTMRKHKIHRKTVNKKPTIKKRKTMRI